VTAFSAVLLAIAIVVLVLTCTPVAFPRSPGDAAGRADARARGVPLIYWRPGCTFCVRLRLMLGRAGRRAVWVNVRRDPAASARVRSVNDGNETVRRSSWARCTGPTLLRLGCANSSRELPRSPRSRELVPAWAW
jgi:hypothetical protein